MLILVAEDNSDNLELMTRFLKRAGHETVTARTGREAIEQTIARRPDLVLMDVELPELSGLDAARRIRSDTPIARTPIIAVTAHAMDGDRARCLEAGCDAYVSKPIDYDALRGLIAGLGRSGARPS
jgi:CheY-like chemotaxis protein